MTLSLVVLDANFRTMWWLWFWGMCVSLDLAAGVHDIGSYMILAECSGDSSVVTRAIGILSRTFISTDWGPWWVVLVNRAGGVHMLGFKCLHSGCRQKFLN